MTVRGAGRGRAERRLWSSCRALAGHGHGNGHHEGDNGSHAAAYANRQGLAHFNLLLVARYSLPAAVRLQFDRPIFPISPALIVMRRENAFYRSRRHHFVSDLITV